MVETSSMGGKSSFSRVTRLHGLNRPLRFEIEDFIAAFDQAADLLAGLPGLKVERVTENLDLPTTVLKVTEVDGDTYKLTGEHTMGFYRCTRGDGKSYKMTELRPKVIVKKIKYYFVV